MCMLNYTVYRVVATNPEYVGVCVLEFYSHFINMTVANGFSDVIRSLCVCFSFIFPHKNEPCKLFRMISIWVFGGKHCNREGNIEIQFAEIRICNNKNTSMNTSTHNRMSGIL